MSNMLSSSEQALETKQALNFLYRNRKKLIIYTLSSIILSVIITFFIPKQYYSFGIVFPTASPSLENNVDNPNFGYDVEADRLIQILSSKEVRDSVIEKFGLKDYYELDEKKVDWRDALNKEYRKDIKFERTPYMSIVISAQTKDPEMSANIVNHIIKATNSVREKIYKQNMYLAYSKAEDEYKLQKHISDSIIENLKTDAKNSSIAGLALLAPNAQLNLNIEQIINSSGQRSENLNFGVNIINYKHQLDRVHESESRFYKTKKMLDAPISAVYLVDKAEPSFKKVSPSFTINALIAGGLAFLFSVLILSFTAKKEN
jgi:capsular polysaccharide biosynthesis protein